MLSSVSAAFLTLLRTTRRILSCWSTHRATPKTPPNSGMQWSRETTTTTARSEDCRLTNIITVLTYNCVMMVSHLTLIDDGNRSTLAKLGLAATFITYFSEWQGRSHKVRISKTAAGTELKQRGIFNLTRKYHSRLNLQWWKRSG